MSMMADHGRYSIWTGDLAMDSWYKAAAERKYDSDDHSTDSGLNETLFFDIGKSNRVKCPSNGRDDWFYQTTSAGDSSANGEYSSVDVHLPLSNSNQLQKASAISISQSAMARPGESVNMAQLSSAPSPIDSPLISHCHLFPVPR